MACRDMVEPSYLQSSAARQEESLWAGEHLSGETETGDEGGTVHQPGDFLTMGNVPHWNGQMGCSAGTIWLLEIETRINH